MAQLLVPQEILMSKIYSHSYSHFWAQQHDYEHEIIQPWLPVSQKYKEENKAQIPLIIHHNEKNQRIYFWCAAKDNLPSQIIKWL